MTFSIDLNDLYLFAQVVERHGFTAAGEALGIPKSRLSRRIAQLETKLGSRLLQRTSRRMSLTDSGQELYKHCVAMIAEAEAGEAAVRRRLSEPIGTLRVSLPVVIADIILPRLLVHFIQRYPKVQLLVQSSDRLVDLIEENIDVAVRGVSIGQESSSLIQTSLCSVRWVLVASPSYLTQIGPIEQIEKLADTDALFYASTMETKNTWRLLSKDDKQHHVPLNKIRLHSNNCFILKEAAMAGMGVSGLPLYACARELEAGDLQVVLPEWRPRTGYLVALFPARRGLALTVRAFVDFLKAELPYLLDGK